VGKKKRAKKKKKKSKESALGTKGQWECECSTLNDADSAYCSVCTLPRNPNDAYYADPHYDDDLAEDCQSNGGHSVDSSSPKMDSVRDVDGAESADKGGWSVSGNKKCSCGSGKKYKKCCKKLAKHRAILSGDGRNGTRNGFHDHRHHHPHHRNGHCGHLTDIQRIESTIEAAERRIEQFRGKKVDRLKLVRALENAKNALQTTRNQQDQQKVANNRNRRRAGDGDRSSGQRNGRSGAGHENVNSAANQVIAI